MKKTKSGRKYVVIIPMLLAGAVLFAGWAWGSKELKEDSSDSAASLKTGEYSNAAVDWEKVNAALSSYDFASNGYYLETEYLENEEVFNCVSVINYDDSREMAFKEVDYQLLISYGECSELNAVGTESRTYEEPMIEISLLDNEGSGEYAVIYDSDGEAVETYGKWFLEEDQEKYLQKLWKDANEMFGLQG